MTANASALRPAGGGEETPMTPDPSTLRPGYDIASLFDSEAHGLRPGQQVPSVPFVHRCPWCGNRIVQDEDPDRRGLAIQMNPDGSEHQNKRGDCVPMETR